MIRAAALLGLLAAAGPAAALTPPLPACFFDGTGPEAAYSGYDPASLGNGFVRYETWVDATQSEVFVLEHCPTARQLVLTLPYAGVGTTADADMAGLYEGMIASETPYTMEQMRDALAALGADVTLGRVDYQSCACATFAGG